MKKLILLVFSLVFLIFAGTTYAQSDTPKGVFSNQLVILNSDDTVDRDYFASGETVRILGTINGDAYIAGGQIVVEGTINGDLLAAGGNLTINGEVTQNVRIAGGSIIINGKVGRNVTVAGGNVTFGRSSDIGGSIVAGSGNLDISAPVGGNILAGAGNLTVSNEVKGDLQTGVGQLTLTPEAKIDGDLSYWSDTEALVSEGATVAGQTEMHETNVPNQTEMQKYRSDFRGLARGISTTMSVLGFFSTLVVGLLLIHFCPKYIHQTVDTIKKNPWKSLGVGFVALIVTPPAILLIFVTIIGIPISFILLAGYLVYLYLAKIFVISWAGIEIGKKLGRKDSLNWSFILGLVAYAVLTLIPVLRAFVKLFVLLFGFGAMLIACKATYVEAKKKELI